MTQKTIAEFVSQLNSLDVEVFVEGDRDSSLEAIRLRCTAPEGTLTTALRQELADRKAELVSYLSQEKAEGRGQRAEGKDILFSPTSTPAARLPTRTQSPLSFAQQRLWFLYQLTPGNPFYNVPAAIRLTGTLDQTALERSFQAVVRRHAALRTTFTTHEGQPVQVVEPDITVELAVVNLQAVAVSDRERISQQLATAEAQHPFNLTTDPLLRVTLLQFDSSESVLLLTMHHIVADGWSLGVLIKELAYCYTAFVEGRSPSLPPLPIQYTDFADWQHRWLQGEVLEKQLAYWRKQLQALPVLQLPSDRPRPAVQTYRGATYPLQISATLTQALETLSQQSGASLFMTLLAAFQTLLYRYTEQTDIAIGCPIANRHRSELEGLIGFFVNSLVLRSNLSGQPTFRTLLERVRNVALEAYKYQDLPFEKLVEALDPDRDLSRNPLFQVAFALQNAPMQPLELPGLTLTPAPLESGSTRFDLEVHLWEPAHGLRSLWQSQEGLSGFISYSTDLFDRDRIGRLIGHFQTLLEGIVANPDASLADLPLLTPVEQQQLVGWNRSPLALLEKGRNQSEVPVSKEDLGGARCFHHLFEAQVALEPEATALVSEEGSLTYQELNQQADQLAHTLHEMGTQPGDLVGLCVDRSADMVIGILGILKAGGAYVPLDPNYPSDRLHFMLTDTQVPLLLTQSWLVEQLPRSQATILCLDQPLPPAPLPRGEQIESEGFTVTPDQLAYVIYTSGSTGTPKGVLLSHHGLCNVVEAQQQVFHLSRSSRILQFSSLSFDASIFELALAFGSGGTLYLPPKSAQLPGMALVQFLNDNAITHALLTPAVLAVLPPTVLPALQVLITGGEACSSQVVDRWAVGRHFFNAYGPTEVTIWATVAELHPGDNPLTIGRPILNTQVYILDANLNPVPAGIPGELYIGGAGLARGYLNRPELTAERFVSNPFPGKGDATPTPLLYKTGDRAFFRTDGTIEFLGRVDYQIKIRGFRVELGEIEATLQRHPAIQEAIVIPSGEPSNEMRLITYFSLDRQHFQQTILQSLQTQHIQYWQTLYNQTYQAPQPTAITPQHPVERSRRNSTPPFNITGWNSSYTGEPIPLEQMQEWVSDRVQQMLALKPKRILEIGCGTGLLLFQLAPHCRKYVGTDFSKDALESIQTQLNPLNLPQVELLHRMATDFEGIDVASFDVVLLNSIVQYFPSQDYLMQVLEKAMQAVAPGGVLFLGDVRSLPLLTAFHTWVQFCQADGGMERTQLQQQVERSRFEEPELAIDPAFFHALRDRFPQIQQVQIRLSRGRSQNEMTQFRYNVLLHLEPLRSPTAQALQGSSAHEQSRSIQQHDWQRQPITVEAMQTQLRETEPELVTIANVANSRVQAAVQAANWLRNNDTPKTVGRMRETLQDAVALAINPEDWWALETVLPYIVEITWSTQSHTGAYDVLLTRQDVDATLAVPCSQPPSQSSQPYTNEPLQSNFARQLIPELRHHLKQTLPDYMVPSAFVPLETLPLTVNGKVNRRALPTLSDALPSASTALSASTTIAPSTQTESTLIDIWQELLRLKQVTVHDNFFELGGHSLLATQMTSRVRDAFGLELPLQSVFETPTIAQLAPILETLRAVPSAPNVPPLVRLDRAAYRRPRSQQSSVPAQALQDQALQDQAAQDFAPQDLSVQATPPSNDQVASEQAIAARSPLVPLTLGGSKQPFFCVHPMFGVVFPYLELAQQLGSDRSFYGLQPLGLDGKHAPLTKIEAIAAYYIQAMQTLQPHGPYFLGGWSFGGLVAFEMAQQLTQAGQQVGLLAMLDTPAPTSHQPSLGQSLKFLLGTALWSTLPFLLDYGAIAANRLRSLTWVSRWQWSALIRRLPEESRLQLLDESAIAPLLRIVYANAQAAYRYVPQPYPDRITLFKATEQADVMGQDSTLGWSTLTTDVQLHPVPGNHLSLLKQPHVQTLAQQLRPYLV
ncbi:amino acid adenylation domain-containing protein [Phormidium sp. FACHB-592]|uniref:Non-ribosomal peptide synthetase n=1 Tax=Stenomitos frigidus AS-A4 TaxID=2933935 RepID=A0ABV0KFQ1_9CYAN|nr:non-ribosomal peptide synthetase [Phormidium sp. FACHB-592]MBD2076663.1 amino acid adenylation domain-containing protein [Phormidium sp. FACHB-592]